MIDQMVHYLAVLDGTAKGQPVSYGEMVVSAPTEKEARAAAESWARKLIERIPHDAVLTLLKDGESVHTVVFGTP